MRVDPKKLLPPATLYVHLSEDSFARGQSGVARFEGVGPITVTQVREFLLHTNVTIKPVIDVATQKPVDGYETPESMSEALHLRNPRDVFPHGTNTGRHRTKTTPPPTCHPTKADHRARPTWGTWGR